MKGTPVLRHKLLIPAFIFALALGLAACGSSESDEDKIVDVIETSATSDDPASCTELVTQTFLDQVEEGEGKAALKECEEDAEDTSDNPDSVEVTEVEVDGSNATADAAFTGGGFDGQTLAIALVDDGGDWKLDEITGFAKFDQAKLVQTFQEQFEEGESIEPEITACIVESLEELEQAEFEELLLSGSPEGLIELAEACQ
jgi:ABC-type glycerol-3-phosphate transport system substrate-binding protein